MHPGCACTSFGAYSFFRLGVMRPKPRGFGVSGVATAFGPQIKASIPKSGLSTGLAGAGLASDCRAPCAKKRKDSPKLPDRGFGTRGRFFAQSSVPKRCLKDLVIIPARRLRLNHRGPPGGATSLMTARRDGWKGSRHPPTIYKNTPSSLFKPPATQC